MNYSDGVTYMCNLIGQSGSFSPYNGIIINYPGKKNKGDYLLTVDNRKAPTHLNICEILHDMIISNKNYNFETLKNFLVDIYFNGTDTNYNDSYLESLKHLIYWTTLQEKINYPYGAGIKLPFCRYFEAIYCTKQLCNFNINDVKLRCNNHGNSRPDLYNIENSPYFYNY